MTTTDTTLTFLSGDAVMARFLMIDNIIERGGHAVRVASVPQVVFGRVEFRGEDLDSGDTAWLSIHPEVFVQLGTEI